MARCSVTFDAPADVVFAALSDGEKYDQWVVGAKKIRAVDDQFPTPGAKLHHTVGAGPVEVDDSTQVEEAQPGRRLRLEARVRPVGVARVEFVLDDDGDGRTRVTMDEVVRSPALLRMAGPLLDPFINARNRSSLNRLRTMVENGRTPAP